MSPINNYENIGRKYFLGMRKIRSAQRPRLGSNILNRALNLKRARVISVVLGIKKSKKTSRKTNRQNLFIRKKWALIGVKCFNE